MIDIDYETLAEDVESGLMRERLERELMSGFEEMLARDEALPPASHYATRIAEIIDRGTEEAIDPNLSWEIYQEVLLACQNARSRALGEPDGDRKGGPEAT